MKNLIKKTNPNPTKGLSLDKNKSIDIVNESNILTCGSICSGIGAFEQALKNLGIAHTNEYAIEINKHARKTYLANHTVNNMYEDLTRVNPKEVPYCDLLLISVPCQSFSRMGQGRGLMDTRGTLTFDALKIVKEKSPKYLIFENVDNILSNDNGNTFQVILAAFEELNYNIKYEVLNSMHFNSPQKRKRLFLIAIRKDIKQEFEFPKPNPVTKSINDYITLGADFSDYLFDASDRYDAPNINFSEIIKLYRLKHTDYNKDTVIVDTKGITGTLLTTPGRKYFDSKNGLFRYLTEEEQALIQQFPKSFNWPVSKTQQRIQIGNSITVSVLEALIKQLLLPQTPPPKVPASTNNTSTTVHKASKNKATKSSNSTCISLLQTIKKKEGYVSGPIITKDIKAIRKVATDRTTEIIKENIDKKLISKNMYINQALINYSKDQAIFDKIEVMGTKELTTYIKDRDLNLYNYDSFADESNTKKLVLFPYAGGKQGVNKTAMQSLVKKAFKKKKYTKFIDSFAGGLGATYNVLPILLENNVEEIVINDINKSIINVYRQIQRKPKQVQRQLASISIDYYKKYRKFAPTTRKQARALHTKIEQEFKQLELKKKMSPRRAALFLFLMHKTTGAMVDYDMGTQTCFFETSYKIINIDFLINKVAIYHKLLTSTKITFKSVQYQTLFKKYKNDSDVLLLIDPPYIEYSEVESENSCCFTYGIDFNHKELLLKIKNLDTDFIYYNNHNPLLEKFASNHGYSYKKNERTYSNNSEDRTKAIEICMTKLTSATPVNNSAFISLNSTWTA